MGMRSTALAAVVGVTLLLGSCGSDAAEPAETTGRATTAPAGASGTPTTCAVADADAGATVTIRVNDDSDGTGAFGLRTPTGLAAGTVRLVVAADEGNSAPVDVVVLDSGDDVVQGFVAVPAGTDCGVDVDLAAGTYSVRFGQQDKSFVVD